MNGVELSYDRIREAQGSGCLQEVSERRREWES